MNASGVKTGRGAERGKSRSGGRNGKPGRPGRRPGNHTGEGQKRGCAAGGRAEGKTRGIGAGWEPEGGPRRKGPNKKGGRGDKKREGGRGRDEVQGGRACERAQGRGGRAEWERDLRSPGLGGRRGGAGLFVKDGSQEKQSPGAMEGRRLPRRTGAAGRGEGGRAQTEAARPRASGLPVGVGGGRPRGREGAEVSAEGNGVSGFALPWNGPAPTRPGETG